MQYKYFLFPIIYIFSSCTIAIEDKRTANDENQMSHNKHLPIADFRYGYIDKYIAACNNSINIPVGAKYTWEINGSYETSDSHGFKTSSSYSYGLHTISLCITLSNIKHCKTKQLLVKNGIALHDTEKLIPINLPAVNSPVPIASFSVSLDYSSDKSSATIGMVSTTTGAEDYQWYINSAYTNNDTFSTKTKTVYSNGTYTIVLRVQIGDKYYYASKEVVVDKIK